MDEQELEKKIKKGDLIFFIAELEAFLPYNSVPDFLNSNTFKIPAGSIVIFLGTTETDEKFDALNVYGKWIRVLHDGKVLLVDSGTSSVFLKKVTDPKEVARFVQQFNTDSPL
jgi:hypothetical protein